MHRALMLVVWSLFTLAVLWLLMGCAGKMTTHSSRTLTCLGFCNDVEVKHETKDTNPTEKEKP